MRIEVDLNRAELECLSVWLSVNRDTPIHLFQGDDIEVLGTMQSMSRKMLEAINNSPDLPTE